MVYMCCCYGHNIIAIIFLIAKYPVPVWRCKNRSVHAERETGKFKKHLYTKQNSYSFKKYNSLFTMVVLITDCQIIGKLFRFSNINTSVLIPPTCILVYTKKRRSAINAYIVGVHRPNLWTLATVKTKMSILWLFFVGYFLTVSVHGHGVSTFSSACAACST